MPCNQIGEGHDDGDDGCLREDAHQMGDAVVAEHRSQPVAGDTEFGVIPLLQRERPRQSASPCRRSYEHPGTKEVGPPAQVKVHGLWTEGLVEAFKGVEQVGPHKEAIRRHIEAVLHGVVLLLVQFARSHRLPSFGELVDAVADADESARFVSVHHFGASDAHIRPVSLFEQRPSSVRIGKHVIAGKPEEPGTGDQRSDLICRCSQRSAGLLCRTHDGQRQDRSHAFGDAGLT